MTKTIVVCLLLIMTCVCIDAVAQLNNAAIDPSFESAIQNDDELLAFGGVKVKLVAGKHFLMGVGITATRQENAPSEYIRRKRVAQANAKASIARMLGSSVEVDKMLAVSDTMDDAEGFRILIIEHSQKILTGAQSVGHWLSADGTVHFEAVAVELGVFKNTGSQNQENNK